MIGAFQAPGQAAKLIPEFVLFRCILDINKTGVRQITRSGVLKPLVFQKFGEFVQVHAA